MVLTGRNLRVLLEVMEVREWVEFGTKMISVIGVRLPSFFHTFSFFFDYQWLMVMKLNYR